MIATGLDRLLASPRQLAGRRFGLLAHAAAVTADLVPAHLALARLGSPPAALFGPEHGYFGVEQDMVPSSDARDPWTGAPIVSLYGDEEVSLRPAPAAFAGLDLLLIDLQDIGSRYYTFAATAVWAAAAALAAGCEVWVLDRPNPLGGLGVEGNLPRPGFESFVGAFQTPVRHGLTVGEIVGLIAWRERWSSRPRIIEVAGWEREALWPALGRPWLAPLPNMPSFQTAAIYPGLCLVEATELSEGRGTTRPFHLVGAPGIDGPRLAAELNALGAPGVVAVPTFFRPQFHKHAGEVCGGVELVVTDAVALRAVAFGVRLLATIARLFPEQFAWRAAPYEFVADLPAIDLLTGDPDARLGIERGEAPEAWIASWAADEAAFRAEVTDLLLYPAGGVA